MHDVVARKAVTGCLHLLNETLICSHSEKQDSVETATFGAEFSAARTRMEQIIDLRNTLRCPRVNPGEVSHVFGDDKAMMDCEKHPGARINKRHTILSFHCIGSLAARGFVATNHTILGGNAVDIVSKHWTHESAWPLIERESTSLQCLQFVLREYTPLGGGGECLHIKEGGKVGGGVSRLVAK